MSAPSWELLQGVLGYAKYFFPDRLILWQKSPTNSVISKMGSCASRSCSETPEFRGFRTPKSSGVNCNL